MLRNWLDSRYLILGVWGALVATVLLFSYTQAQAKNVRDLVELQIYSNSKCVGVNGNIFEEEGVIPKFTGTNGSDLHQWDCNLKKAQLWVLEHKGDGQRAIRNIQYNRCAGIDGGNNAKVGSLVHLWDCNSSNRSQRWEVEYIPLLPDSGFPVRFKSVANPDLCLEVRSESTKNYVKLVLKTCISRYDALAGETTQVFVITDAVK